MSMTEKKTPPVSGGLTRQEEDDLRWAIQLLTQHADFAVAVGLQALLDRVLAERRSRLTDHAPVSEGWPTPEEIAELERLCARLPLPLSTSGQRNLVHIETGPECPQGAGMHLFSGSKKNEPVAADVVEGLNALPKLLAERRERQRLFAAYEATISDSAVWLRRAEEAEAKLARVRELPGKLLAKRDEITERDMHSLGFRMAYENAANKIREALVDPPRTAGGTSDGICICDMTPRSCRAHAAPATGEKT